MTMKKFAMLLALAMFVGAPVYAQAKVEEKPAAEEPKKEEPKAEAKADHYKAYRTKGNTWTLKTTAKYGSFETVTFSKHEVTEVTDEKAVVKLITLDKDNKELSSTTYDVKFAVAETPKEAPKEAPAAPKTVEEKIKVEAGEFDCIKYESEAGGGKTTSWTCKTYFIVVKSESKSDFGTTTLELVKAELK